VRQKWVSICHPGLRQFPDIIMIETRYWIPACAGMTETNLIQDHRTVTDPVINQITNETVSLLLWQR